MGAPSYTLSATFQMLELMTGESNVSCHSKTHREAVAFTVKRESANAAEKRTLNDEGNIILEEVISQHKAQAALPLPGDWS